MNIELRELDRGRCSLARSTYQNRRVFLRFSWSARTRPEPFIRIVGLLCEARGAVSSLLVELDHLSR